MLLAVDPEVPQWVINAIMSSPTACAIVYVGMILRTAINHQAPVVAGAIKLLAEAIQASTLDMQDVLETRATVPERQVRRPKRTGAQAIVPQD